MTSTASPSMIGAALARARRGRRRSIWGVRAARFVQGRLLMHGADPVDARDRDCGERLATCAKASWSRPRSAPCPMICAAAQISPARRFSSSASKPAPKSVRSSPSPSHAFRPGRRRARRVRKERFLMARRPSRLTDRQRQRPLLDRRRRSIYAHLRACMDPPPRPTPRSRTAPSRGRPRFSRTAAAEQDRVVKARHLIDIGGGRARGGRTSDPDPSARAPSATTWPHPSALISAAPRRAPPSPPNESRRVRGAA